MKPSKYQQAIYQFCSDKRAGSAIINAVAGSGKTTTAIEALKCFPKSADCIFLAFNRSIADELVDRGVPAKTFHSLVYGPVMRYYGLSNVDSEKVRKTAKRVLSQFDYNKFQYAICKVIGLLKQIGFVSNQAGDFELTAREIIEHHDIDAGLDPLFMDALKTVYAASYGDTKSMDFDDLLMFGALNEEITLKKYDVVFVDESQDTNLIQRILLRKISKPKTRVIAIGDRNQAIYGFRGADSQSMNSIKTDFKCVDLDLSVTYRCDRAIVEMAKKFVPQIEAREDAGPGLIKVQQDLEGAKANDLVVCRTTRELIRNAFSLLKQNKSVMVLGREIGQGLKALINKMKASNVIELIDKLDAYKKREVEKLLRMEKENQAQTVADKVESILCLCEDVLTVPDLLKRIDDLFADKSKAIKFATIHKSKGLEAKRVFWLDFDYHFHWLKKDWMLEQENNLRYVATTRAKHELYLIPKRK